MPCGCKKGHGMNVHGGGIRKKKRKRKKRGGGLIGGRSTWTPAYLSRRPLARVARIATRSLLGPFGGLVGSGMSVHGSGMAFHGAGLRGKRVLPRRGRGRRLV